MKTIKHFFLLTASAFLLFTTSCVEDFYIKGNGIAASEGRITANFTKVKSSGSFDIHITHGDVYEVVVRAEETIVPYIETYVSGSTLNIDIRGMHSVRNKLPMEVFITTPLLEGIKQSGSGNISTDYFECDDMDITISGSGNILTSVDATRIDATISGSGVLDLSGSAKNADFVISGSGKMNAYDLSTINCKAAISGSGSVEVNVERFLDAHISGSGNILYSGNPSIESHISGSGKVIQNN